MIFLTNAENISEKEVQRVAQTNINEWKESIFCTDDEAMQIDAMSKDEKISSFTKLINFGTAGLRGKMLPGFSNMNKTTVALATYALGTLVLQDRGQNDGIVIACDSRNNSDTFSRICASVLANMGIKVYIFDSLRPTPELSFAIRYLKCRAGINITASHNTREYNGYKVYWSDGAQLPPENSKKISEIIPSLNIKSIECPDFEKLVSENKITVVSNDIDEEYIKNVLSQLLDADMIKKSPKDLKILYTSLHGAGYKLVPEVLSRAGFENVSTVKTQIVPDGNFPTVEKPNPQFIEAFSEAIKQADDCDLIVATDPDADRMGVALKNTAGNFITLTGNEIALILLDYIIRVKKENKTMPENPAVVKSLVSSKLAKVMCEQNGIKVFDVYTGFKYIGEKIKEFEQTSSNTFLFGFEESYGYLAGTYARDKDGVLAAMLISEASLYYKLKGLTPLNVLAQIYKNYGFWGEYWSEAIITSPDFKAQSDMIMNKLRSNPPTEIAGEKLVRVNDWLSLSSYSPITKEKTAINLKSENMLGYILEQGTEIIIRPSGTEPKIKLYYFINCASPEKALERQNEIKTALGF